MSDHQIWLNLVKNRIVQHQSTGGFQVLFPEYRTDITRILAHFLELEFYDYRLEEMKTTGWNAGKISLDEMTHSLHRASTYSGIVAHNIEALLSTKSKPERQQWLANFFSIDWPNMVIIPLSLYQDEALEAHARICDIQHIILPEESFLMRLAI